ncbi:hypothetical protein [Ferroacidibacillus organovorans]|nr:hypothetical protein [Ferroacidibacillus organovorans]
MHRIFVGKQVWAGQIEEKIYLSASGQLDALTIILAKTSMLFSPP